MLVALLGVVAAPGNLLPGGSGGKNIPLATHPPQEAWRGDILLWHIPQFWLPLQMSQERNTESYRVQSKKGEGGDYITFFETYMRTHYVTQVTLTEYEQ